MPIRKWSIEYLKFAVKESRNYSEVLKFLNLKGNSSQGTIKKFIIKLKIDMSHFESRQDVYKRTLINQGFKKRPLSEILVKDSNYDRGHLKKRLYDEGLKERNCELCGQGEIWQGKKISLIIDHINGINNDNRLINLRIVCPNCAATLDTHCGRNVKSTCIVCGDYIKYGNKNYCSLKCYHINRKNIIVNREKYRKSIRPPFIQLKEEIIKLGFSGTGRKYNVSDTAIRKWLKYYKKCERLNDNKEAMNLK